MRYLYLLLTITLCVSVNRLQALENLNAILIESIKLKINAFMVENKIHDIATCVVDGDSVTMSYLPQKFTVHGVKMTGEILAETCETIGPSYRGLIATISIQKLGEANQHPPQVIRETYWTTQIIETPFNKHKSQGYGGISYGTRTNPDLITNFNNLLKTLQSEN